MPVSRNIIIRVTSGNVPDPSMRNSWKLTGSTRLDLLERNSGTFQPTGEAAWWYEHYTGTRWFQLGRVFRPAAKITTTIGLACGRGGGEEGSMGSFFKPYITFLPLIVFCLLSNSCSQSRHHAKDLTRRPRPDVFFIFKSTIQHILALNGCSLFKWRIYFMLICLA